MTDTKGQGGVPWGWVGAGATLTLVLGIGIGIGVWLVVTLAAPATTSPSSERAGAPRTAGDAPTETRASARREAPGGLAAGGFAGQWFVAKKCRGQHPFPTVDIGLLTVDRATVTYKDTSTPAPTKGDAQVSDGRLSFRWKETAASPDYSTLTGRLIDQNSMEGSMKSGSRPNEVCTFEAKRG